MGLPDLLTEADFLVREFPAPGNPHRPLAVVSPCPGEDASAAAVVAADLLDRGYGGLVLDPLSYGPGFLEDSWFNLVEHYVEACRLLGLFLWLVDGMPAADLVGPRLDALSPGWRGTAITTRSLTVEGRQRLDTYLEAPGDGALSALIARPLAEDLPPVDLRGFLEGSRLRWDPPAGRWEIVGFWVCPAPGPANPPLNLADSGAIAAWLRLAFVPYGERFGPHLGRTIQGILVQCPAWPGIKRPGGELTIPLLTASLPGWRELADLLGPPGILSTREEFFTRQSAAVARSYLAPLRDWCWRHRLRVAGYRLGGEPLPGLSGEFDLGGMPDLRPDVAPDRVELAALAGLARYFRQEKTLCQLPLTGRILEDRDTVGRLAAAGANHFLVRHRAEYPREYELALTNYAARLAMAVSAGSPADETALPAGEDPALLPALGREVSRLAQRGLEVICLPAAEAAGPDGNESPVPSADGGAAAAGRDPFLPGHLRVRVRKVENWTVCTCFNLGTEPWRGPLSLPELGAGEIWHPATGEIRPATQLEAGRGVRLPLALAPGEAQVAVVRRPGVPRSGARHQIVRAHLTLARNWRFEAAGGNVLPLAWRKEEPGSWAADLMVLHVPAFLRLEGKPPEASLWLNGVPLPDDDSLARCLQSGANRLELRGARSVPVARLRGVFTCRGEALAFAHGEISGPWTLNGYPYFSGPGIYRQSFVVPEELVRPGILAWIELAALADAAVIRLNGRPVGTVPWPPYRLSLGPATVLKPGENMLEIEVHAAGAKPVWGFRGLLGEVSLLFADEDGAAEGGEAGSAHWMEQVAALVLDPDDEPLFPRFTRPAVPPPEEQDAP